MLTRTSGNDYQRTTGKPRPEDDTALLVAALGHTWAWHDGRTSRALQVLGFYLVAAAFTGNAYATALTDNDYRFATVIAIFGLGLTALASAAGLGEVNAASKAEPALIELQDRVASKLGINIRMTISDSSIQQRRTGIIVIIGLALLVNISSLLYALIH